jgi:hypothetical protein
MRDLRPRSSASCHSRCGPRRLAWLLLPSAVVLFSLPPAQANATRLRDWILRWLGNPPIAVGGTRGAAGQPERLCLLHPLIRPKSNPPEARLVEVRPQLVSATPLARIALENADGKFLGQQYLSRPSAGPGTAIPWPRDWPSLEPGRQYLLVLQTMSSSKGVPLLLTLGSAQEFQQQRALQSSLGASPEAWMREISRLLKFRESPTDSSRAQAASLLFSTQAPPSLEFQRLRDDLLRDGCVGSAP